MKRLLKTLSLALAGGFLLGTVATIRATQTAKPSATNPAARASQGLSRIWKSLTTGREYRVSVGKERLLTEWVNLPPRMSKNGAYMRSELRREKDRWIGTTQSYLPIIEGEGAKETVVKRCQLETRIEIHTMTANRITGRAEAMRRLDPQTCKIVEAVWANFVWIPKRK